MISWKRVLISSITKKQFDREYYEQVIATWQLNGWLTVEEATECMEKLDEVYPVEQPQEGATETTEEK